MKNKAVKVICITVAAIIVLWGAVFFTDYMRCGSLKEPVFAIETGENQYKGLGYEVKVERSNPNESENGKSNILSVEMWFLGRIVSASIT